MCLQREPARLADSMRAVPSRSLCCLAVLFGSLATACSDPSPPRDAGIDAVTNDVVTDASTSDARDAATCSVDARATYPDGPFGLQIGDTIADLHFTDAAGHDVALHDFYAPCVSPAPVLVVRTFAAWSSFSRQAAAHTARYRQHAQAARMRIIDLLVRSQDNVPADPVDLAAFRPFYDVTPDMLLSDPRYQIPADLTGVPQLPNVLLVDTTTMRVFDRINPILLETSPLAYYLDLAFATLDGTTRPRAMRQTLVDDRFTDDQWELVRAMSPLAAPPPDPTNAHADDPAAAQLGSRLFTETRFSPTNTVSCATCHRSDRHFADGLATGVGAATGDRNTPSLALSAYTRWLFWDGRADSEWSQALGPVENPGEMASSRLAVAHVIADHYATEYEAIFGPLPPLSDIARFPLAGRPGDASFDAMAPADRDAVTRVFVNVGKSIEAFERTLRAPSTALDRYAAGDFAALTAQQRDGLYDFVSFGCVQCHHGPTLTDDSFHNIGMPTGRRDGAADHGRNAIIAQLVASPFRADGAFSDARTGHTHLARLVNDPSLEGQFHTPSLRGIAATAPWGHGGTFTTLEDVVRHYGSRQLQAAVTSTTGPIDPHLPSFDTGSALPYVRDLTAFLDTLDTP